MRSRETEEVFKVSFGQMASKTGSRVPAQMGKTHPLRAHRVFSVLDHGPNGKSLHKDLHEELVEESNKKVDTVLFISLQFSQRSTGSKCQRSVGMPAPQCRG